jgi:hypothetical protein
LRSRNFKVDERGLMHVTDEAAAEQFIAAANAFRMQKMGTRHLERDGNRIKSYAANTFQARRLAKLSRRQHQSSVNN